jgi:hypothetical protein
MFCFLRRNSAGKIGEPLCRSSDGVCLPCNPFLKFWWRQNILTCRGTYCCEDEPSLDCFSLGICWGIVDVSPGKVPPQRQNIFGKHRHGSISTSLRLGIWVINWSGPLTFATPVRLRLPGLRRGEDYFGDGVVEMGKGQVDVRAGPPYFSLAFWNVYTMGCRHWVG